MGKLTEEEKKKAAKELVSLTHVETRKQQVDQGSLNDMIAAKKQYDENVTKKANLSPEEQVVLSAFEKKRLMLERIWIIVNQTRTQAGLAPIKQSDIRGMLDGLVKGGFLEKEEVEYEKKINEVYILTEKGEEMIL